MRPKGRGAQVVHRALLSLSPLHNPCLPRMGRGKDAMSRRLYKLGRLHQKGALAPSWSWTSRFQGSEGVMTLSLWVWTKPPQTNSDLGGDAFASGAGE